MAEFVLAHLGIPLIAGLVFLFMVAATDGEPLNLKSCNDIALDLVILSIGATGAIFLNPRLNDNWKSFTAVLGIIIVLVDLLLASVLVYRRRWRRLPPSRGEAYLDLVLGTLSLTATTLVFYFGYEATLIGGQIHE